MPSRSFRLDESAPDDISREITVQRWPVISVATSAHLGTVVSNYGADHRNETEYFPQLLDGRVIPGIFHARFDAAMAIYAASEGAE